MRVKNRSVSVVGYNIPDMHIRRRFVPGEVKEISKEEIDALLYQSGGHYLLANYLQIHKDDLRQLEMIKPEQEYYLSEDQVKNLVVNGSMDEFLDALDFAPQGVIDLIKNYAISLPLNDLTKLEAIKKKTGLDASKTIANMKAVANSENESTSADAPAATSVRRRRVETNSSEQQDNTIKKYNIIE